METTQICNFCDTEKPLELFSKESASKNGRKKKCRLCVSNYRKANLDQIREYQRDYTKSEKGKEKIKAYRNANVESIRTNRRKYWVENKDSLNQKRSNSPEIYKQYDRATRQNLSVKYVKEMLRDRKRFPNSDFVITQELIDLKRLQIKLHRLCQPTKNLQIH
jgi:hypothetical protein